MSFRNAIRTLVLMMPWSLCLFSQAHADLPSRWSVVIGTAPRAETNAAGLPQDVHIAATGNNEEGWLGSGFGFFPFFNEGVMMTNLHLHP